MNPAVNKATKGLGASFKGVTAYLMTPKPGEPGKPSPERTGFVITQNLPTDDPAQAWKIMARTAQDREALKAAAGVSRAGRKPKDGEFKPVFHYALSWHPDQQPTPEQMQEAARSSLKALQLDRHQALIVQHVDEDRAHLHVVVNRVDPETGKLDPLSNNIRKLDRWAHDYEKASGEIVSPDRAAKYEALEQGQKPEPKRKKNAPRKEWEAQQPPKRERSNADRSAERDARVGRYKQAAADVRERFRPEWAEYYRTQKQEVRALDRQQRDTLKALRAASHMRRAPTPQPYKKAGRDAGFNKQNNLAAFYNANRDLIWQGIPEGQQPKSTAAILNAPAMRRAIENAHAKQRADLDAAHVAAKQELQGRHDVARQEAQRAAWKPVAPAQEPALAPASAPAAKPARHWGKLALGVGMIAAAAVANRRDRSRASEPTREPQTRQARDPQRDPQRSVDEAAARFAHPVIKPPANESPGTPAPTRDDLAEARARSDSAAERIRAARERNARARNRGPTRDWLD